MDDIKQVMDDPLKSSVMLFLLYKGSVHIDKLEKELDASRVELQDALDFLESSGLLTRKGDYCSKTERGLSIAYGLQGYEAAPQTLATLAPEILSPSSLILDIGCQGGYSLSSLRKYSRHLIGIDVDLESLYVAKIRGGIEAIRADGHFLPFKSSVFDLVICYGVIPVIDEKRVIAEASRVLKKGGTISLSFHGIERSLRFLADKRRGRKGGILGRLSATLVIIHMFMHWVTGKRLRFRGPFFGTFQTERSIRKIMNRHQMEPMKESITKERFMGAPIITHLEGRKL